MSGLEAQAQPANQTIDLKFNDNINLVFGTGGDATIDYNGTNLIIDPKAVGSGNLTIKGDVHVENGSGLIIGHTAQVDFGAIPEFQVLGTATPDSSMGFARFENNASGPDVRFLKSRGATIGANTLVQDGDKLGRIRWQGADEIDFNTTAAELIVEVDGGPAGNDIPGRFIFRTRIDGGSLTEKMRIDNAGKVTVDPGPIDLDATAEPLTDTALEANYSLIIGRSDIAATASNAESSGIAFRANTGANVGGAIIFVADGAQSRGELRFYTKPNETNNGVNTLAMTLTNAQIMKLAGYLTLLITDNDGSVEGSVWYDASEDKLKFKTAAGVETITSS